MPSRVQNLKRDARQPLLVEVLLHQFGNDQPVVLHQDFFESLTISLSAVGAWTGVLTLFDRTGDFVLSLLAADGNARRITLRWGWDEDDFGIDRWPTYEGAYAVYTPAFTAEGTRLVFELLPVEVYEQAYLRKPRTFKKGERISAIVDLIADENGWDTQREFDGGVTVEPTKNGLTDELSTRGEGDLRFIQEQLAPRAQSVKPGHGSYTAHFDSDNVFHFHTDEFFKPIVAASYTFGQDAMGDVISFEASDLKFIAQVLWGAGDGVYWSVDSRTGRRTRLASTDLAGLPGPKRVVDSSAALQSDFIVPNAIIEAHPEFLQKEFPFVARDEEDFKNLVRARFAKVRKETYVATAEVRGTHAVAPQDLIHMAYLTPRRQEPHFLSGTFRVDVIEHTVDSGGWQTSFEMHREGISQADGAKPVTNVTKVAAKETAATQGSDTLRTGGAVLRNISPKDARQIRP